MIHGELTADLCNIDLILDEVVCTVSGVYVGIGGVRCHGDAGGLN
jgi:hypothetical protein